MLGDICFVKSIAFPHNLQFKGFSEVHSIEYISNFGLFGDLHQNCLRNFTIHLNGIHCVLMFGIPGQSWIYHLLQVVLNFVLLERRSH